MRVIFAGTPDFAVSSLQAILSQNHEVLLVISQPDKPRGRGQKLSLSPVKALALEAGIPVATPAEPDQLRALPLPDADIMIVAAYGSLIPPSILAHYPFGAINIHTSLLPRWRGAAPIQRAIAAGDLVTGISIMQMDKGLDTGPVLLKKQITIAPDDTASSLYEKLKPLAALTLIEALNQIQQKTIHPIQQDEVFATWAHKLKRSESQLNLLEDAATLERLIRALNPWPGATLTIDKQPVKILSAFISEETGQPGKIAQKNNGLIVFCGKGSLNLQTVQSPGGRPMNISRWLQGHPVKTTQLIA
ncbi:MAG: methionyl-tRNA formyltransferase [Proteobacteria bacterium]|nr:methionyl-tRNA formyltransferase [Pseudomonadota bacterium]MDE3208064.1 methionyl-tRNA formyltransferase [Pseudomonadota bacterium]